MNEKVIACIPSKTMREFLTVNNFEMSAFQQATIVSEYADKKDVLPLFQILLEETNDEAEKLLLSSAIDDFQNGNDDFQNGNDFYSDKTQEIYDKNFPHERFPLYPFLEVCGLPALFKKGDVIRKGSQFYYVGFLPLLRLGYCDFSDECYLCYPLSWPINTEEDLINSHEHIHVCEAERASKEKLTRKQKNVYGIIRALLRIMQLRKENRECRRMKKLSH